MTEPAQEEISPVKPEAVAKQMKRRKCGKCFRPRLASGLSSLNGIYLVPGAAFALMPIPLVIQYRVQARKLTFRPSQRIYVQASRPGLNKIPFQLVQLFATHKTNSCVGHTFNGKKKAN